MLLVDAYNVLHTTGVLPPDLAGQDVPGLIRLIAHSRYADRELTVVCDGVGSKDRGVSFGHARVLFSGAGREADDLIERLIARYAKGRTLTVVSSDRRLHRAARRGRASGMASDDFLRHLAEDHRRVPVRDRTGGWAPRAAVPLDPYSVRQWMDEFGFEPPEPPGPREIESAEVASGQKVASTSERAGALAEARKRAAERARQHRAPASPATFGTRLGLPEPVEPVPEPIEPSEPRYPAPEPVVDQPGVPRELDLDPELRRALEEWRDVVSEDDLDMTRWIDGVHPI